MTTSCPNAQAKKVVDDMMEGRDPQKTAKAKGLQQISGSRRD